MHPTRPVTIALGVSAALLAGSAARAAAITAEQTEFFEAKIRPVLVTECHECHGAEKQKGGLRLDYRDGWKAGGDSGNAIVPGKPGESLLIASIRHSDPDLKMPAKRPKLSDAVIADFEKWIAMGAPDPRDQPSKEDDGSKWEHAFAERRNWWSFQPLTSPALPAVKDAAWSQHPVDRHLLAKMEAKELRPSADADPRTVLRRLSFLLTGLPPNGEETQLFLREWESMTPDQSVERAVDRLLASPRFGERFARHWMDLVRYADTHGSEGDPVIPEAWRYRDYLVRAFNQDVPLDHLIVEHIAGDLLPKPRWNQAENFNESLIGLSQFRLLEHGFQPVDTLDEQVKTVDNQLDVVTKAFQGLTVSCARCHDHKFDPISQRDYYAMYGVLASSRPAMRTINAPVLEPHRAELARRKGEIKRTLAAKWKAAAAELPGRLLRATTIDQQMAEVRAERANAEKQLQELDQRVRQRVVAARGVESGVMPVLPTARWSFETDAKDALAGIDGELRGGARIERGRLIVDGRGAHVRTKPLARDLRAKTLEAWVALAHHDQRGGGVITVESADGAVFDSIVFAEQDPLRWGPGSDFFRRGTREKFPEETAAANQLIHVALVFREDGSIQFFRNGEPLGSSWKPANQKVVKYEGGKARMVFGMRHTGGGNPFLAGEIEEARLYERALSTEEIAGSFRAGPNAAAVGAEELSRAFTEAERRQRAQLTARLEECDARLAKLEADAPLRAVLAEARQNAANPLHAWTRIQAAAPNEAEAQWRSLQPPATRKEFAAKHRWNVAKDFRAFFREGTGIGNAPSPAGEFAILPSGERAIAGIYPGGAFTAALSRKDSGIFATPQFRIETDYISFRTWGGGGSQVRLIVDHYPLGKDGVFPRAFPNKDEPEWKRMDVRYRKGSMAYLEFATAADLTRWDGKVANSGSWFGVSEIVFHDGDGPANEPVAVWHVVEGAPVRSAQELAARYATRLAEAVDAWERGTLTEPQRELLDFFVRRGLLPAEEDEQIAEYRRFEAAMPEALRASGIMEADGYDAPLLPRGDHKSPGERVPRAFLSAVNGQPFFAGLREPNGAAPSGRMELAQAIVHPQNPLTARVMVNRVWHWMYGRGLVPTVDNFGRLGEQPTHPELLDHLAGEFMRHGWSLKWLVKHLATTRAFRLSSESGVRDADPDNVWLTHFRLRRLEAEAIRDSLLAVSGRLDLKMYGPGENANAPRRSLWLSIRRTDPNPFLETFDAPKPFSTTGRRDATNVPAQSLTLLNSSFVIAQAQGWAKAVVREKDQDTGARVTRMFERALGRLPSDPELTASTAYIGELARAHGVGPSGVPTSERVWQDFAQSIFNLKEFVYLR